MRCGEGHRIASHTVYHLHLQYDHFLWSSPKQGSATPTTLWVFGLTWNLLLWCCGENTSAKDKVYSMEPVKISCVNSKLKYQILNVNIYLKWIDINFCKWLWKTGPKLIFTVPPAGQNEKKKDKWGKNINSQTLTQLAHAQCDRKNMKQNDTTKTY